MSNYGIVFSKIYDPVLYVFMRTLRLKVLEIISKNKYENILDFCCGTGNQLKILKTNGIDAIGIDLSKDMLRIAKSGNVKANCLEQNAENTKFSNNTFDLVMITFALHEKSHDSARKIVEEMIRVSKSKGHLLIVDYAVNNDKPPAFKKVVDIIERLAGKEHCNHYKNYVQSGGIDNLLKELNLKKLESTKNIFGNVEIRLMEIA